MSSYKNPEQRKRNLDLKFVGGLAWTAGAKWATQFLTWASILILARLLSPSDYGLGEMAGLYFNITNVLAEFGIGTAVLHMPELSRKALSQLHLFSCLLCTALFALATLGTPLVASFFRSSDHLLFFMVGNTSLFITGFQAVPMGLLQRDMDYRRLSLAEAAAVTVQSVVMVITAWLGWGAWALMAGASAGKITSAVMVCSWKHVGFSWPRWQEIRAPLNLGRQLALGRLAWAAYTQADVVVIGRILGGEVLGIYRMAMNLASAPAEKISTLIMRTASPLFANVMNDRPLVRRYYLIMAEVLSLVVMPLMLGLAIVAPQAVPVVLGAKWLGAVAPLRWLAIFMILRTMGILSEQVLVSQLLTRFTMRMSILNLFVMPAAFVLTAKWLGTGGVASAWLILSPITLFPLLFVLLRKIELPWSQYLGALFPAMAGSAAMVIVVGGLSRWQPVASLPPWMMLACLVAAGGGIYAAILLAFFRERVVRYLRFLKDMRKGEGQETPVPAMS